MCMDMMARMQGADIMVISSIYDSFVKKNIYQVLHFDCMRMGQDQVAFLKPEDNGGLDEISEESETEEISENDPVDPERDQMKIDKASPN